MEVKLYKREGKYFNQEKKKDIPYVNFYVKCNDTLIPVEVKYFPNPKTDNRDLGYSGRMEVMRAFAEHLPEKEAAPASKESSSSEAPLPSDNDVPDKK